MPLRPAGHSIILRDVSYGDVSAYMAVSRASTRWPAGLRCAGVEPSGLDHELRGDRRNALHGGGSRPRPGPAGGGAEDQIATPTGKALVRVVQASLREHLVTVDYGPDVLARQLAFGLATSYVAVSPGAHMVQFTALGEPPPRWSGWRRTRCTPSWCLTTPPG